MHQDKVLISLLHEIWTLYRCNCCRLNIFARNYFRGKLNLFGFDPNQDKKTLTLLGGPWVELHKEIKVGSALFKYPSETEAVSQYAFIAEAKAPSWNYVVYFKVLCENRPPCMFLKIRLLKYLYIFLIFFSNSGLQWGSSLSLLSHNKS